jgi:hypothetical protein
MNLIDRDLQRQILEHLAAAYPVGTYTLATDLGRQDDDQPVLVNALYLEEHGLISSGYTRRGLLGVPDEFAQTEAAAITARGIDFLADDGGLSAILGVVTIRLDTGTLRALLEARIDASPAPPEEKSRLKKALHSMSAELWAEATKRLASEALDRAPDALALVRTLLALLP